MYACFLDCEKAFDRVWWNGLMYKLHSIGVHNKLWFLFKEGMVGSKCAVLINGAVSQSFEITRGIKQGGMLSMFMYVVSTHDFHQYVDQGDGLRYYDLQVSSLTLADDAVLLSLTKAALERMMGRTWTYGRKNRTKHSVPKTKCMVFDSKRPRRDTKRHRRWKLGPHDIEEVDSYCHVGIILNSHFVSKPRTVEMCSKGKSSIAALGAVGARDWGLNPIVSASLWQKVSLPSMLHGSELWTSLTSTEIDMLEVTQKYAAKLIQGFPTRTHDEIARGLLGWPTMESIIETKKLNFLQKLIMLDSSHLEKDVFLYRLAEHIMLADTNIIMKGFIPDVVNILRKYGLTEYLENYCLRAEFPPKVPWKNSVKRAVKEQQKELYQTGLLSKGAERVQRVHNELRPFILYCVAKRNPDCKRQLLNLAKLQTVAVSLARCPLCYAISADMVQHIFTYCQVLNELRNDLWDQITNLLGVELSVTLFQKTDSEIVDIFLGGLWEIDTDRTMVVLQDQFRCCVAKVFHRIYLLLKDIM